MLSPSLARIHSFRVVPALPEPLKPLLDIAHNLWWTWSHEAVALFTRLDRDLWEGCHHNPVMMLGSISQDRLERAAADRSFLHALGTVHSQLVEHTQSRGWFGEAQGAVAGHGDPFRVAYFSAEFGLTECLQVYSGGLGVLAGDHLKSASELGLPLVAVGLLYRNGYCHQYLNPDGFQQETYPDIDAPNQPVTRVLDPQSGEQRRVWVELPGRGVAVGVWKCQVGRVPLYLLDTNLPENAREDREITRNLYGGDFELRIKQEIVLGIGGTRALRALGENPTVWHINEGHAAFLGLERIREIRRQHDVSFDQAREAAAAAHIFTTHTPVPAGIDRFPPKFVEAYFGHMLPELGLDLEGLLALGRENVADQKEFFSMAVLALRTSRFCNGVSLLHGHVSRSMWKHMWPGTPAGDVPIGHVTNGVHARSWLSADLVRLFDRYLGDRWHLDPSDADAWAAIDEIPDEELWAAHVRRREHLVAWCRRKIRAQLAARGAGIAEIESAAAALELDRLTIGFARRFATYKRGTLLFRDPERLERLLSGERGLQLLVAGKSHPADTAGKALIREIVEFARQRGHSTRVVFLEDYDIEIARRLVQGCDIWLNNPVRGLEASGTSGMKAALNGCVNASVLDGWWDEAFDPELGFAIGRGEQWDDAQAEQRDDIESKALYQVLEGQIIPEFYDRDSGGIPRKWVARMKRCIRDLAPRFNTHRMVMDYARGYYFPAHNTASRLVGAQLEGAKGLNEHLDRLRRCWHSVRVQSVAHEVGSNAAVPVRSTVRVTAAVELGELRPDEVHVQLYHGRVASTGELTDPAAISMEHQSDLGEGRHQFAGSFRPSRSGQHGFSVRVLPADDRLVSLFVPGLITWDAGQNGSVK
ncbi:MAG: alpha-glucan family phosphorylase [Phycisphaerae bacterium]|nr:alpha-glucan family phosphorylase [Phycisphaerae bacterium]